MLSSVQKRDKISDYYTYLVLSGIINICIETFNIQNNIKKVDNWIKNISSQKSPGSDLCHRPPGRVTTLICISFVDWIFWYWHQGAIEASRKCARVSSKIPINQIDSWNKIGISSKLEYPSYWNILWQGKSFQLLKKLIEVSYCQVVRTSAALLLNEPEDLDPLIRAEPDDVLAVRLAI